MEALLPKKVLREAAKGAYLDERASMEAGPLRRWPDRREGDRLAGGCGGEVAGVHDAALLSRGPAAHIVELCADWSTRSIAARTGLSQSAISRIWRAFALQPHRTETFKLSSDPLFIEVRASWDSTSTHPSGLWSCVSTRSPRSRPSPDGPAVAHAPGADRAPDP